MTQNDPTNPDPIDEGTGETGAEPLADSDPPTGSGSGGGFTALNEEAAAMDSDPPTGGGSGGG
jgi:hypothetical protein